MTLTAFLVLLGEEIRGEDAPVTKWETGINQTAISNHCGSLAGTWTGTYRGLDTSPYCSGWYTCPSVRLIFEDAAGDGSAFLVARPAASGCYLDPNPNGCEDTSINHIDFIAFCEDSKVYMEPLKGLVTSTKLMLYTDSSSSYRAQYNMHKYK